MLPPMKKLTLLIAMLMATNAWTLTLNQKIDKAHEEYAKRHLGYQSSFLPRPGVTKGDDYRNCIAQKYYRNKDSHDFCAWHAGIGKYQ